MKKYRLSWMVCVLLVFFEVACTANLEVRKKQEEASRNLGEAY